MSNSIHDTHLGRRMRIIPFIYEGEPCFTLCIEWLDKETGRVKEDLRYQMGAAEFDGLAKSVEKAKRFRETMEFED